MLRWGLQHGVVIIPKSSNCDRIKENATLYDFTISPEDMTGLDNLNEDFRVYNGQPFTDNPPLTPMSHVKR